MKHVDSSHPQQSYWLVGLEGNVRRVRLSAEGALLVGRGAHNHLVLNDYRISRQHSRIAPERDGFVVYDLNSANGTFVNGVSVRRQQLKPNDEVRFGPHAFRVELDLLDMPEVISTKWRPSESITQFFEVKPKLPPHSSGPASQAGEGSISPDAISNVRDTIRPEGMGSLEIEEDVSFDENSVPLSRESNKFRAQVANFVANTTWPGPN